eukprot:4063573-Alexandrium_andersonii.AAC.1
MRVLHRILKSLSRFKPKSPPIIKDERGMPVHTTVEAAHRWLRFFAGVHTGVVCDQREHFLEQQPERSLAKVEVLEQGPQFMPTVAEIVRAIKRISPHRATGEDGIPGDLLKAAPVAVARLLHPLFLKAFATGYEPFAWRGGQAFQIPKAVPDKSLCSSHRAVVLADAVSKLHHTIGRSRAFPDYARYVAETQFGGMPKRGPDFASHLVRATLRHTAAKRMCGAVLFVDIATAYYAVLRPLVMSCESPGQVLASLREKNMPEQTLQAIASNLEATAADVLAGLSPAAMTVLEASHTANWLSVNGATPIIKDAQGSIPGDPWADLFFGLIQARVMRVIRARVAEEGLQIV